MGIDIKWVLGDGDLAELVRSSAAQRGLTYDFASLEAANAKYLSLSREYQEICARVNSLQNDITKQHVACSKAIPAELLRDVKAGKLKSKQMATQIKKALADVEKLRLSIPNTIDPRPIELIARPKPLQCQHRLVQIPVAQMCSEYIERRMPYISAQEHNGPRTIFEKNKNRWMKENHEMPLGLAGEEDGMFRRIRFICRQSNGREVGSHLFTNCGARVLRPLL